jgi:peroxiredoxin
MPEGIWGLLFAALWVLLVAQSAMIVVLSRHMRRLYEARTPDAEHVGPAMGAVVPEMEVADIAGRSLSLGGVAPRKRLLLFLSPGCPGCRTAIRQVQQVPSDLAQLVLVWSMVPEQARDLAEEYQIRLPMVADGDRQLWKQFNITGVPFAVVVDEGGRVVAKAFAHMAEQLTALVTPPELAEAVGTHRAAPDPAVAVTK